MAAEEQAAGTALDKLTEKVGPFPVWVWGIGLLIAVYLVRKRTGTSTSGPQTDPAGNVGTIDPATGYVYGTPQDQAHLSGASSTSTDTTSSSGSTVGGQYPDNASWGRAAVNYLVSLGEDPTAANEAVQSFLGSQTLTPQQQSMINLAIQGIGAPPQLPGPTGTPPPPVVTPPSGIVYATNPPTGLAVSRKTSATATVKWNATTNADGYTVRWGRDSSVGDGQTSVGSGATTATLSGLTADTLYYVTVQATPAKTGAPFAQTTLTTDAVAGRIPPSSPAPSSPSVPPPQSSGSGSRSYTVVHGDTLIGIANKVHVDWHTLYNNNKNAIEAAARSHGLSSSDGGHWIYPGEVLYY